MTARHALVTLRHPEFRRLWAGALLATTGGQVQTVAVAWHVYLLTDSPLQVGLIGLFRAIPMFVLALAGGAIADRFDRKRVVLAAVLSSLLLTLVLAVATVTEGEFKGCSRR